MYLANREMNKELFMAVCDRLRAEVPELRWIDAEMNQLNVTPRPPVAFPCCLVDMRYLQCVSQTAGTQRVRARSTISRIRRRRSVSSASAMTRQITSHVERRFYALGKRVERRADPGPNGRRRAAAVKVGL